MDKRIHRLKAEITRLNNTLRYVHELAAEHIADELLEDITNITRKSMQESELVMKDTD